MNYLSIPEARQRGGLRLILCAGTPGVWGEAVKAMFHVKNIPYSAVAMQPGQENPALQEWTAQSSAPAIVTTDDRVLTHWEQFVWLAEQLSERPRLIPDSVTERSTMFGLLREIAGIDGLGWLRRLQSLHASGGPAAAEPLQRLADKYGYSEQAVAAAAAKVGAILALLAKQLHAQSQLGSGYYIGSELSALDLYAAVFIGVMVRPLPAALIPMPDGMRWAFEQAKEGTEQAPDSLFEHCQRIFTQYLHTPLDF